MALLLTICLVLGSALAAPAVAKKRRHHRAKSPACQRLKGHDFAKARSLKLVAKRVSAAETDLKGCRLRGKVHVFAIRLEGDTSKSDFIVHSVADRWALVSASSDSPYSSDSRTWVFDIDSGRILYTVSRWHCVAGQTDCAAAPPAIAKGLVDRIGKSVFAFTDGSNNTITGYGTDGGHRGFDSGPSGELPASSLTLGGSVANWVHSGQQRHGQLP
jgi:hypothetical protein